MNLDFGPIHTRGSLELLSVAFTNIVGPSTASFLDPSSMHFSTTKRRIWISCNMLINPDFQSASPLSSFSDSLPFSILRVCSAVERSESVTMPFVEQLLLIFLMCADYGT